MRLLADPGRKCSLPCSWFLYFISMIYGSGGIVWGRRIARVCLVGDSSLCHVTPALRIAPMDVQGIRSHNYGLHVLRQPLRPFFSASFELSRGPEASGASLSHGTDLARESVDIFSSFSRGRAYSIDSPATLSILSNDNR